MKMDNELPNYSKAFNMLVVNKSTGKYMTEGMFTQALKNKDIVIVDDGTGFFVFFSYDFSLLYKSVDSESK